MTTTAVTMTGFDQLELLVAAGNVVALTGAGISTDSGIPDYRGPTSVRRNPMTIAEFCSGEAARRRYWSRSHVGWTRMTTAEPNDGHRALAQLEQAGLINSVITQNVDGLHQRGGSREVIDLHGRIDQVICLDCGERTARYLLQERLEQLNPGFVERHGRLIEAAPDGDARLGELADSGYRIGSCTSCGGRLKPDVVFFGENVPRDRVAAAFAVVDSADLLLVAGSSLAVMSGLRFVRRARLTHDIPVVIINRGPTRADDLATLRIDDGCSETLTALATRRRPSNLESIIGKHAFIGPHRPAKTPFLR